MGGRLRGIAVDSIEVGLPGKAATNNSTQGLFLRFILMVSIKFMFMVL